MPHNQALGMSVAMWCNNCAKGTIMRHSLQTWCQRIETRKPRRFHRVVLLVIVSVSDIPNNLFFIHSIKTDKKVILVLAKTIQDSSDALQFFPQRFVFGSLLGRVKPGMSNIHVRTSHPPVYQSGNLDMTHTLYVQFERFRQPD